MECMLTPLVVNQLSVKLNPKEKKTVEKNCRKAECAELYRYAKHLVMLNLFLLTVKVTPSLGPIDGGTRLTISGKGLGYRANQSTVMVGSASCQLVPEEYIISKRLLRFYHP